jgi:hypothetical protein
MVRGAPSLDFVGQDVFVPGKESGHGLVPRGETHMGRDNTVGSESAAVMEKGTGAGPEEYKPIDASELTTSE